MNHNQPHNTLAPTGDARAKGIYKVTIVGSIANVVLLVFKLFAGIFGRSDAMLADAAHSLSDFVTDLVVLVFVRIASKPVDKHHEYGHGKFETLASAIIALMLLGVGAGIFYKSASAIWEWGHGAELEQPGWIALIAAVLSIAIKEVVYRYTIRAGRRLNAPSMVANAWHHRSDALSSIGTLVGIAGAILLGTKWRVLDPLAACVVSVMIIRVGYKLLKPGIQELTERSLPDEELRGITEALEAVLPDCDPHSLRTRRVGNRAAVDVHVRMDGDMSVAESHALTQQMEEKVRDLIGKDTFISIHVEPRKKG